MFYVFSSIIHDTFCIKVWNQYFLRDSTVLTSFIILLRNRTTRYFYCCGDMLNALGPNKVKTPTKGYTKRLQLIGTSPEKPAPVDTSLSGYSRLSLPDVRSLNRQRRSPKKRTETGGDYL